MNQNRVFHDPTCMLLRKLINLLDQCGENRQKVKRICFRINFFFFSCKAYSFAILILCIDNLSTNFITKISKYRYIDSVEANIASLAVFTSVFRNKIDRGFFFFFLKLK